MRYRGNDLEIWVRLGQQTKRKDPEGIVLFTRARVVTKWLFFHWLNTCPKAILIGVELESMTLLREISRLETDPSY